MQPPLAKNSMEYDRSRASSFVSMTILTIPTFAVSPHSKSSGYGHGVVLPANYPPKKKFYQSMHSVPSSFELPEGQRNPYLHYDEYEQYLRSVSQAATCAAHTAHLSHRERAKMDEEQERGYYGWMLLLFSLVCICICLLKLRGGKTQRETERSARESRFLKFLHI